MNLSCWFTNHSSKDSPTNDLHANSPCKIFFYHSVNSLRESRFVSLEIDLILIKSLNSKSYIFVVFFFIYGHSGGLSGTETPLSRTQTYAPSPAETNARDLEPHDQEVEDLLAWTNMLP